ncbi:Transposase [Mycetohabitans rhizoxinica HKI 454]|uniref:Transposase n=3 Tax=Mycetohabitans rhizoxinica TaxID=412963 RepID=E5ARV3_MYCRK|nr:hypothetical protein [Mycetohabitans sp. B2]MCG1047344.1 hypothetical protein [Mycetohabitans sp. B6]CBW75335.1 Transposase [Mycetohabitans rhizoxinica HKI 454]
MRAAARNGLKLRQNDNHEAPRLASQTGRYAHAKPHKRMKKALWRLWSRVGRVVRGA